MKTIDPSKMSEAQKRELLKEITKIEEVKKFNSLALYKAHPFQARFHLLGSTCLWRMLMAPNRSGKTYGAAAEVAMHLTGRYPAGWEGKRFNGPISAWVIGTSYDQMKEACHALLMGKSELGTGLIPAADVENANTKPGVPGMYANIRIRNKFGGFSTLEFKAYNQGRNALQGASLDLAWMDEEPTQQEQEQGIVSEIITRLNDRKGILLITYTPLEGETPLTRDFYPELKNPTLRGIIQVGARDLPHMANEVEELQAKYKPYEWRARIDGLPALGEGAIFPFTEDKYVTPGINLPTHTRYIMGMDYGINHPTAMALVGWDQASDTIYVVAEFREKEVLPPVAASWSKRLMPHVKHAWPHDMSSREKGSGKSGQLYYKEEGLAMCDEYAHYDDERKNGLEDSIDDIYHRIETGRFKVFSSCTKLIGELGKFHRKDHKVVPIDDDLIAACRYAIMMLREARSFERMGKAHIGGNKRPVAKNVNFNCLTGKAYS